MLLAERRIKTTLKLWLHAMGGQHRKSAVGEWKRQRWRETEEGFYTKVTRMKVLLLPVLDATAMKSVNYGHPKTSPLPMLTNRPAVGTFYTSPSLTSPPPHPLNEVAKWLWEESQWVERQLKQDVGSTKLKGACLSRHTVKGKSVSCAV